MTLSTYFDFSVGRRAAIDFRCARCIRPVVKVLPTTATNSAGSLISVPKFVNVSWLLWRLDITVKSRIIAAKQ